MLRLPVHYIVTPLKGFPTSLEADECEYRALSDDHIETRRTDVHSATRSFDRNLLVSCEWGRHHNATKRSWCDDGVWRSDHSYDTTLRAA